MTSIFNFENSFFSTPKKVHAASELSLAESIRFAIGKGGATNTDDSSVKDVCNVLLQLHTQELNKLGVYEEYKDVLVATYERIIKYAYSYVGSSNGQLSKLFQDYLFTMRRDYPVTVRDDRDLRAKIKVRAYELAGSAVGAGVAIDMSRMPEAIERAMIKAVDNPKADQDTLDTYIKVALLDITSSIQVPAEMVQDMEPTKAVLREQGFNFTQESFDRALQKTALEVGKSGLLGKKVGAEEIGILFIRNLELSEEAVVPTPAPILTEEVVEQENGTEAVAQAESPAIDVKGILYTLVSELVGNSSLLLNKEQYNALNTAMFSIVEDVDPKTISEKKLVKKAKKILIGILKPIFTEYGDLVDLEVDNNRPSNSSKAYKVLQNNFVSFGLTKTEADLVLRASAVEDGGLALKIAKAMAKALTNKYGPAVVDSMTVEHEDGTMGTPDDEYREMIFDKMEERFVEEISARLEEGQAPYDILTNI